MTSSHSGEDVHVRTVQALFRRLAIPQSVLACGTEGMPLDALTAARLARDGERPVGAAAHVLRAALGVRAARQARRLGARDVLAGRPPGAGGRARRDRRGVRRRPGAGSRPASTAAGSSPTPSRCARSPGRSRSSPIRRACPRATRARALAPYYVEIRDAMLAFPELVAGTRDRLDTSLMKAAAGRFVSKSGAEGLRGVGILRGARGGPTRRRPASRSRSRTATATIAGPGRRRSRRCARSASSKGQALRVLARYHRPPFLDPHGRLAAEAIADFDLAPVGELVV